MSRSPTYSARDLADASRVAYNFGRLEAWFVREPAPVAAHQLIQCWKELEALQDRVGFAFHGSFTTIEKEPASVTLARNTLARHARTYECNTST